MFISFEEFIPFGLFVELEDEGDFGLEVLEEGGESFGAGSGEVLIFVMGVAVGLLNLVDFVKAHFLNLIKLDMVETFPELLLKPLQFSIELIDKFLIIIEHLRLLNLVLLPQRSKLFHELVVVLGN